ncbi:urea ABC transporter permease subunit UrtC [Diaphorobacter aerolatus]|uniref:urea ABC transporter permease subunit UrtC n=1 Tax=Diaphorobacter aerolatus TaxID=1288495 RepID=UPI001D00CDA9|nr:urea ABC transporter permease subunit UrtC [Diaphorobacter aerolatus]
MGTQKLKLEVVGSLVLLALLLTVVPMALDPFRLNLMSKYLAFAFVAIGVVLTWGYGGMLSLGQGIFFGLGGYMLAMFLKLEASAPELPDFMVWSSVEQLPLWWAPFQHLGWTLLFIAVLPAALAYLFSYAVFKKRVSGVYFSIVTLALALTMTVLIVGQQGDTGGANGITDFRTLLQWPITTEAAQRTLYFVEVFVLAGVMGVALFVARSRLGKVLIAIRDQEGRVRFSGYNTAHIKAAVFALAAFFSAIGGAFYALQVGLIAPNAIGVVASVEMVIFAAVGGRLSIAGAVLGAVLVGFLRSWLSETFPKPGCTFWAHCFSSWCWCCRTACSGCWTAGGSIAGEKALRLRCAQWS